MATPRCEKHVKTKRIASNASNIFRKKWLQIITIIIAICGGFPGIISIIDYFRDRPILGFHPHAFLTGTVTLEDSNIPVLIMFGTVTNQGTKPLIPFRFYLKIKVNSEWLSFFPEYIPNAKYFFQSNAQKITMNEDLSKMNLEEWKKPILNGAPAQGCFMFVIDKHTYDYLQVNKSFIYKLICEDVYNNKHTFLSTCGPFDDNIRSLQKKVIKYDIVVGPNE